MKKTNKLWLALLLTVLVAALLAVGFTAAAEEPAVIDQGYCGPLDHQEDATWVYTADRTLTISGTGPIRDGGWTSIRQTVRTLVIEEGVTGISDSTFHSCTFTTVTLPESLTSVSTRAFTACKNLTSVSLGKNVTNLESGAFYSCMGLTQILISEENPVYTSLDGVVFTKDMTELICYPAGKRETPFTIPESVTKIRSGAFGGTYLGAVNYDGTVEAFESIDGVGSWLRVHFTALQDQPIIASGTCGAQEDGANLSWTLNCEGILTISGTGAMADFPTPRQSPSMVEVVDPETGKPYLVQSDPILCDYRSSFSQIVVCEGVTTIGENVFSEALSLESVSFPNSLTKIGKRAFYNSSSLRNVRIPESVTTIEKEAFAYTEMPRVKVPATVTEIGDDAFNYPTVVYGYIGSVAATRLWAYNYTRFYPLCSVDDAHNVRREDVYIACIDGSYVFWYCDDCAAYLPGGGPADYSNVHCHCCLTTMPATEPTATEHGYTAGEYCTACKVWVSGHEVVHNAFGAQTVIKPATEEEEDLVDIVCTVCGETVRYTAEKLPHTEPQPSGTGDSGNGFWMRIQSFFRGIIDWFLRLFKWLG